MTRLHAVIISVIAATTVVGAQPRPSPLPYELAFAQRAFPWLEEPAVSPDGTWVAYSVMRPSSANRDARYQPNGTPSSAIGSTIYVISLKDRAAAPREVCPATGNCWRPSWSPDSTRVAFFADADGPPQLWISTNGGPARRLGEAIVKPKLWVGDEPIWSADGAEIFVPLAPNQKPVPTPAAVDASRAPAVAADDGPSVTVFRAGREAEGLPDPSATALLDHFLRENNAMLGAIDAGSGRMRTIVPADATPLPSVLRLSPSGKWVSYLSVFKARGITSQQSTMDLAIAPAGGGAVQVIAADLPVGNDYHRLNYTWHPSEDRLVFIRDGKLWLVDLRATVSSPVPLGDGLGTIAASPLWFTRDGQHVIVGTDVIDDKDYSDPRAGSLSLVPLAGGAVRRLPLPEGWDYRGLLKANATTVWQPDAATLVALLRNRATGESGLARMNVNGGAASMLWTGIARAENFASGGHHTFSVARYQDAGTPPGLYRFAADGTRERLVTIDPRLDAFGGGRVEIFESAVPLHNGEIGQVRTAVMLPPGAAKGAKLPAVVLMYPGSDVSTAAEEFGGGNRITIPTQVFTSRGFAVIYPNLRLGPNREPGNPAQEMTDVLLPQVYRAAELGYIDLQRVGIAGQSFGGYGTAAIISQTNLFRAAVAISGIYDLPGTYGDLGADGSAFWVGWSENGQARMGTHPWASLQRYLDNSPYYQADKIRTPLLIIHGDADDAYHDGQKLFSALRRLDRTVQFASYKGQGHVVSSWTLPNAVDAAKRAVEFFQKYLGMTSTAATPR